jgi:MYXO-CTERM domain-containing protein
MTQHSRPLLRAFALFASLLAIVLFAQDALAAGTFRFKTNEATEVSGGWRFYMTIELPKPPSTAHQTMRLLFTKTSSYERALVDGHADPVTNKVALKDQNPLIESFDVSFGDASGKVFKGTHFDFMITRPRNFEAGEYKVELRTTDGVTIGAPVTIILKGDNPVVDRRSITFSAKGKDVKKIEGVDAGGPPKNDDTPAASGGNGDVQASGTAQPFIPADAYNKTPEEDIKVRPKSGCGCEAVGTAKTPWFFAAGPLAAFALLVARRRRQVA